MEEGTFFIFFLSLLEPCLWCSTWYINIRVTPTILWKNGSNGMINLDIKPNKALIFILIWKWNLQMNSNWTPDYYMLKQANSKKNPPINSRYHPNHTTPPLKDSRSVRERMIMFGQQPRGLHWPHTIRWRPSSMPWSLLYMSWAEIHSFPKKMFHTIAGWIYSHDVCMSLCSLSRIAVFFVFCI